MDYFFGLELSLEARAAHGVGEYRVHVVLGTEVVLDELRSDPELVNCVIKLPHFLKSLACGELRKDL